MLSHQGNANKMTLRFYINHNDYDQKLRLQQMLAKMWRKGNTLSLLVGLQAGTTILEINLVVSQKIVNSST